MNSLVEKFLDIEEKYDLWNHNIGEFQIWNRTRLELFRMIERFVCGSDIVTVSHRQQFTREGKIYTEEEKRIYVDELVDFYKNTEILIINSKHRMLISEGGYICPITGMISQLCDAKIKYCIQSYRKTENEEYIDLSVIDYDRVPLNESQLVDIELVNGYVNDISNIFEMNLSVNFDDIFYDDFREHILYVVGMMGYKGFYQKLLSAISPKAVVVASGYAIINSIILEAANELGIKTIEMQHGQIGTEHIAYNSKRDRSFDLAIPRYMLVYGQFDIDTIRNYVCKNRMIATGNLFLDRYVKKYKNNKGEKKMQTTVLVVSYIAQNTKLVDFAIEIKQKHCDWDVIYRFHPEETIYDDVVSVLQKEKIIVDMDFNTSVYDDVSKSDYIIGSHSTVLCEALCFNKKTFRIDVDNGGEIRESEKHIRTISNVEDFEAKRDKDFSVTSLSNYFYAPNKDKMSRFFNEICR